MSAAPLDKFTVANKDAAALAGARADMSANEDEHSKLQRKVTGAELRLALRDLRDGVRGMIRVSPLISVATAALIGAAWARRGRRRPVKR
jgi:Flp pilus assembly protein CpaB